MRLSSARRRLVMKMKDQEILRGKLCWEKPPPQACAGPVGPLPPPEGEEQPIRTGPACQGQAQHGQGVGGGRLVPSAARRPEPSASRRTVDGRVSSTAHPQHPSSVRLSGQIQSHHLREAPVTFAHQRCPVSPCHKLSMKTFGEAFHS